MKHANLKSYFRSTGIKQSFLAEKLGISNSFLSLIKNGERMPSPKLARKISKHTGIPILNLLDPEEKDAA